METIKTFRHEYKFVIPYEEMLNLRSKLDELLTLDRGNSYKVRSLYFDSYDDCDYYDKLNGEINRKKIRSIFIVAAVILTAALILPILYHFLRSWELEQSEAKVSEIMAEHITNQASVHRAQIYYEDQWYVLRDDLETILGKDIDSIASTAIVSTIASGLAP